MCPTCMLQESAAPLVQRITVQQCDRYVAACRQRSVCRQRGGRGQPWIGSFEYDGLPEQGVYDAMHQAEPTVTRRSALRLLAATAGMITVTACGGGVPQAAAPTVSAAKPAVTVVP